MNIIFVMRNIAIITILGCLLAGGCQNEKQQREDKFERVSAEIEQLKTQASEGQTGNIRVTVRMLTVDESSFAAIESIWRYADTRFVLKRRQDLFPKSGLKVGVSAGDLSVKFKAVAEKSKYSEESEVFLVLADGTSGYIDIGKEIAIPKFYYLNHWYTAAEYQFQKASRGFDVHVRTVRDGDLVNIRLVPVFSRFLNDGGGKRFTELETNITVKPGQQVLIGGGSEESENFSAALLGGSIEKLRSETVIMVNVEIL